MVQGCDRVAEIELCDCVILLILHDNCFDH